MKAIKILLGIIAVNLTLITLIQLEIFPPKAYANEINTSTTPINTNYGLVPLNEDGSIDVNVVSEMDVYLKGYKVNNETFTIEEWYLDVEVAGD